MENENKAQEMQLIEQSLHNVLMQKQAFQMEEAETKSALKEIEGAGEEVYKIVGQLMIKSDKKRIEDELKNKEKMIGLRLNSLQKQEENLSEQLSKIREELIKKKK